MGSPRWELTFQCAQSKKAWVGDVWVRTRSRRVVGYIWKKSIQGRWQQVEKQKARICHAIWTQSEDRWRSRLVKAKCQRCGLRSKWGSLDHAGLQRHWKDFRCPEWDGSPWGAVGSRGHVWLLSACWLRVEDRRKGARGEEGRPLRHGCNGPARRPPWFQWRVWR